MFIQTFSLFIRQLCLSDDKEAADYWPLRQQAHNVHTVVRACQRSAGRRLRSLCCSSATLKTEDVVTRTV